MRFSLNVCTLRGNLGAEPECKYLPDGTAVCEARLATQDKWLDREGKEKEGKVQWHRLVVWGRLGEAFAATVKKGAHVEVEGSIEYREWDKPDGGGKGYATEIRVKDFHPVGRIEFGARRSAGGAPPDAPPPGEDDIPFGNG
jgi:single-strand DNA-binding protein